MRVARRLLNSALVLAVWTFAFSNPPKAQTSPPASDVVAWTLSGLERALRSDPPGPRKAAVIHVAQNEWESLQIAMRSPTPAKIIDIESEMFAHPEGAFLAIDSIHMYREHQLHITHPTYRNDKFRAGWYPDALIPFRNPMTGERLEGGRFQAVPFVLPANETHAFWIDFYIPKGTMPGRYKGGFKIKIENAQPIEVPVEVVVRDFALPKLAAMYTQFGSPAQRIPRYYRQLVKKGVIAKEPDYDAIEKQCARLMTDHRVNCQLPRKFLDHKVRKDGSFELSEEQIEGIRQWALRYHVNAVPLPRPNQRFKDPVADREKIVRWLKSWDAALDKAGLGDRLAYTYLKDEPNDAEAYKFVQRWGKLMRESGSRVKVLVVEQTKTQNPAWGDLYGAVDIWVPLFPLFDPASARKRQALGEQIWTYTALCQRDPTPWWHTDFPLSHYRCPAWIAWRYGMKGLLYWGGLSYWYAVEDVWTDPATYQPGDRSRPIEKRRIYNGEGSLTYPARDVGFDGVVPSIRLKTIRDSLEDFDYLALLESRGKRKEALDIIMPIAGSWHKWSDNPADYLEAREKLAALLAGGAK